MSVLAEAEITRRWRALAGVYALRKERGLAVGLSVIVVLLVAATAGQFLLSTSTTAPDYGALRAPSSQHIFGTDGVGRDIFVRVLAAIRLDLSLALIIAALAIVVGTVIGLTTGYFGGAVDLVVMRLVDILMSIPAFILALITAVVLGNTEQTMVLALAIAYMPTAVRLVRSQVVSLRELPMIETSRAIGTPGWQIVAWHILPNTFSVLTAQGTLFLAWAILDTAAMSFIGVGVHPPTPELGAMIADGAQYIVSGQWWIATFPGIFIAVLVISFNLVGDGLRDFLDPTHRR